MCESSAPVAIPHVDTADRRDHRPPRIHGLLDDASRFVRALEALPSGHEARVPSG
jgi:hypothetical protein